jgi:hypothetical protein
MPWVTVNIVRKIARNAIAFDGSTRFLQEIVRQSIVAPNSMLDREAAYGGFSHAPLLSDALFCNWRIVSQLDPFMWTLPSDFGNLDQTIVARMANSVKKSVKCLVDNEDFWQTHGIYNAGRVVRRQIPNQEYNFTSVILICDIVIECANYCRVGADKLRTSQDDALNCSNEAESKIPLFDAVAQMIVEVLCVIAPNFEDSNDAFGIC